MVGGGGGNHNFQKTFVIMIYDMFFCNFVFYFLEILASCLWVVGGLRDAQMNNQMPCSIGDVQTPNDEIQII